MTKEFKQAACRTQVVSCRFGEFARRREDRKWMHDDVDDILLPHFTRFLML